MESMGDRLKLVRKALKKSQQELAEVIGVKRSTYTGYENGADVPMYVIMSLHWKYMLNIDYMVEGKGKMFEIDSDDMVSSVNLNTEENMEIKTLLDVIKRQNAIIDNLEKEVAFLKEESGFKNESPAV